MATDDILISLKAGIDYSIAIPVIDSNGDAKDVSGWSFESDVRVDPPAAAELATFTIDMSAAAAGTVTISLTGVETQAVHDGLANRNGVWDVKVTVAGKTSILFGGPVATEQAVTRT